MKIYRDLSRFVAIYHDFYQNLLRLLLTDSEFFLGFSSFTESLLEHSYQIALIYQHGQIFDEKPLYICEDQRDLLGFIGIYKDLLGFVKIYWDL